MPFLKTGNLTTTIYEYDRGDKIVRADPALIWRKLNSACREDGITFESLMNQWGESAVKPEDTDDEIDRKMMAFSELEPKIEKIVRAAFKIPEVDEDGNGGTIALVLSTLNDFLMELAQKKSVNTEILQSSLPPLDGDRQDSSRESSGLID